MKMISNIEKLCFRTQTQSRLTFSLYKSMKQNQLCLVMSRFAHYSKFKNLTKSEYKHTDFVYLNSHHILHPAQSSLRLPLSRLNLSPNKVQRCTCITSLPQASQFARSFLTSAAALSTKTSVEQPVTTVVPPGGVPSPGETHMTVVAQGSDAVTSSIAEGVSTQLLFPEFPVIQGAECAIYNLHHLTGLPWWVTIMLTALTLRVVLIMPMSLYSLHNAEKLNKLQPEIAEIAKRLKLEVSMAMHQFKWDEKKAKDEYVKNMKRLVKDLYIKHNCHPLKSTASFWLQFPLWISVSYSLRNMATRATDLHLDGHAEFKSLTEEGVLWFTDLTMTDSTWILPVLMGSITLFNIEMTHLNIGETTKYRKRLTIFLRCLALLFVPISSTMPSAMVLYWISSGTLAAVQNVLHDYSPFRRLVGLSMSPTESSSPLRSLAQRARQKYLNR